MVNNTLRGCYIMTVGTFENWNNNQVKEWIKQASGRFEPRVTGDTTHLVTNKKEWEKNNVVVKDAIERKEEHLQNIEIVSFEWLKDSLQTKSRKKEKNYRFSKAGSQSTKQKAEPRSTSGLMKQLYDDHTYEPTPAEKAIYEKRQREDEELARQREDAKMKQFTATRMSVPELAAIFKKGSQKAKAHLMSDNHHIYHDSTGFHYDITLTKVDTKHNTNERYSLTLQIFESNHVPPTYGLCTTFSGTKIQTQNNVVVCVGSPWPTVHHAFTRCFEEKTGVKWTDRIKAAHERQENDRAMKGKSRMRGSAAEQMPGPRPMWRVEDFDRQGFQYFPPAYGPKGEGAEEPLKMSVKKSAEVDANGAVDLTGDDDEEILMSGGNGEREASLTELGTRSASPVGRPAIECEEIEKFKEAVITEELDPFETPFEYGEKGSADAVGNEIVVDGETQIQDADDLEQLLAEAEEAMRQGGGSDFEQDWNALIGEPELGSAQSEAQDTNQLELQLPAAEQAMGKESQFPEDAGTQDWSAESTAREWTQNNSQVLGKRKDSPTSTDELAEKKQKTDEADEDPETQFREAGDT